MAKIICVDFDGVLHSYASGWKGVGIIPDKPVPGAIDWLKKMIASDEFDPVVYSARSKEATGRAAMRIWLCRHGMTDDELSKLDFPSQKPPAFLTLDDRAICFTGIFPCMDQLRSFKPWNKKDV